VARTGLLLVNLGTPDAPTTPAVRRYLREFLSDPKVIDIPAVPRFLLVNGIIAPFRAPKSAEAYQKIWSERGSPLLVFSQELLAGVRAALGEGWQVELAMRYGNPSIAAALKSLASCERIVVLPLYPQNADATTGSTVEEVERLARGAPPRTYVPAFHDDPGFLDAFAEVGREVIARERAEHALFSFHGLPERHVKRADRSGSHCLGAEECCDALTDANRDCYRAQSFATARAIAQRVGMGERFDVSFQSRLGRTVWISPYTEESLAALGKKGVKRLAVFCPAFVADCLETLEEIGLRGAETFRAAGGESLTLVPSLNASPKWVEAVASMARRHARLPIAPVDQPMAARG